MTSFDASAADGSYTSLSACAGDCYSGPVVCCSVALSATVDVKGYGQCHQGNCRIHAHITDVTTAGKILYQSLECKAANSIQGEGRQQ